MSDGVGKLARLAQMIKDAELARLAGLARERRRIEAELDRLRAARHAAMTQTGLDAASLAGVSQRWTEWCDMEMQKLFAEAATAAARAEAQMYRARQALGRSEVLEKLAGPGRRQ